MTSWLNTSNALGYDLQAWNGTFRLNAFLYIWENSTVILATISNFTLTGGAYPFVNYTIAYRRRQLWFRIQS